MHVPTVITPHMNVPFSASTFREYATRQAWQALIECSVLIRYYVNSVFFVDVFLPMARSCSNTCTLWAASLHFTTEIYQHLRGLKACSACGRATAEAETGTIMAVPPPVPDPRQPLPDAAKRRKLHGRAAKPEFQPGRGSIDGTPTCAHCHAILQNQFGLEAHIIENGCRSFNENRPLGPHVPMGWPHLQALIQDFDIDTILTNNDYLSALQGQMCPIGSLGSLVGSSNISNKNIKRSCIWPEI